MNSPSVAGSEHRLFYIASVCVTVIVLAGFIPNYTLRFLRHDPNLTLLVHAHGLVMASWIALFLIQTLLVARHRVDLHRRLGVFGAWIAVLVILVGVPTLIHSAARKSHNVHSARFLWMLAAFDGIALLVFFGLVCAAIVLRERSDFHKRLMLLATLSLLGPAFGRLTAYANGMRGDSDLGVLLLCMGIVVVFALVDSVRSHRLHPAFLWGGASVIGMDVATYFAKLMI
ncbi:MAG TPA: hypothetical protein VGR64_03940 [Terracidiphilus sp.]|nr:hypothetical protein [Terracidiphilus sp.]